MSRLSAWLATLPSTNARIAVTLGCVALTTLVYLSLAAFGSSWEPSATWLMFLGGMSGIDTVQFYAKRRTHEKTGGASPPSGDNSP